MALKTKLISLPKSDTKTWGRDAGKHLLLTEMSAEKAEKWGYRAVIAMKGNNGTLPMEYRALGMVGVAIVGLNIFLRSTVNFADIEPLLDEMLTCIQVNPDFMNHPDQWRAPLPGEIEEPRTLMYLRSAILELHTGFSLADAASKWLTGIMEAADSLTTPT